VIAPGEEKKKGRQRSRKRVDFIGEDRKLSCLTEKGQVVLMCWGRTAAIIRAKRALHPVRQRKKREGPPRKLGNLRWNIYLAVHEMGGGVADELSFYGGRKPVHLQGLESSFPIGLGKKRGLGLRSVGRGEPSGPLLPRKETATASYSEEATST